MQTDKVSAILLAGGYSSRMGCDKAALLLDGKTLLQHQADTLRAVGLAEILVSGCREVPAGTRCVEDLFPHRGPLSGIHAGLTQCRCRCALVLPVDMPLVSALTLRTLIRAHTGGITVLVRDGQPEPLLAVYDAALAPRCASLLQTACHSPRRLLETVGFQAVPHTGPAEELLNCNTPAEFERLQKIFQNRK